MHFNNSDFVLYNSAACGMDERHSVPPINLYGFVESKSLHSPHFFSLFDTYILVSHSFIQILSGIKRYLSPMQLEPHIFPLESRITSEFSQLSIQLSPTLMAQILYTLSLVIASIEFSE